MNPLSWATLDAWARLTDTEIRPHEARALITLDTVMCYPGDGEDDE